MLFYIYLISWLDGIVKHHVEYGPTKGKNILLPVISCQQRQGFMNGFIEEGSDAHTLDRFTISIYTKGPLL